jgi:hypothetical protein
MKTLVISSEAADNLADRLEVLNEVGIDPNGDFSALAQCIRDHSTMCLMVETAPSPVQRRARLSRAAIDDSPPWRP